MKQHWHVAQIPIEGVVLTLSDDATKAIIENQPIGGKIQLKASIKNTKSLKLSNKKFGRKKDHGIEF